MKKSVRNYLFAIVIIFIVAGIVLFIYILKPWIPSKYRDPLYCDESINCGRNTDVFNFQGISCVNEYYNPDMWLMLGGPNCNCNLTENRCVLVPYTQSHFNETK